MMAEDTGTIEAKGLYHRYELGDKEYATALAVDVKVSRGEFLAIIGPNGSGKSTLAKI